jgi:hypothetical protein
MKFLQTKKFNPFILVYTPHKSWAADGEKGKGKVRSREKGMRRIERRGSDLAEPKV